MCLKYLLYLHINNLDSHKNGQGSFQSLAPSPPPFNFNVGKTALVESQEESTTLYQRGGGNMLELLWCLWHIFDLLYFCSTLHIFSTKSLQLLGMPRIKDQYALELNSAIPSCPNIRIT